MRFRLFLVVFTMATALVGTALACECETLFPRFQDKAWKGEALSEDDIAGLGNLECDEMRILHNTPYARHGYTFGNDWVRAQFEKDSRYQANPDVGEATVGGLLTEADRATVKAVVAAETQWQCLEKDVGAEVAPCLPAGKAGFSPDVSAQDDEKSLRDFAKLDKTPTISPSGIMTVRLGYATPAYIVDTVLFGGIVENVWLPPLTCKELGRAHQAVYARYNAYFVLEGDRDFFASILHEYKPDPHNSPASVAGSLKSVDQLNLLRVEREMGAKNCKVE